MRDALIFAGVILGGVGAVFSAGDPAPPDPVVVPAADLQSPAAPGPAAGPRPSPSELRRAGDGHFYAGVTANGRPVTMLVDTGASVVALTGQDARAIGLSWSPGDVGVVGTGAGGPIRGVKVTLERVSLGAHEARGVAAVIIPDGLPISLLGQSFLATVDPVRIERDRMTLGGDQ